VEKGRPLFGNDQEVAAAQGRDVEEGQDMVVLVHPVAWNLAGDDLVEYGLPLRHGLASPSGLSGLGRRVVHPF
jgi:hypothetical protein